MCSFAFFYVKTEQPIDVIFFCTDIVGGLESDIIRLLFIPGRKSFGIN